MFNFYFILHTGTAYLDFRLLLRKVVLYQVRRNLIFNKKLACVGGYAPYGNNVVSDTKPR